MNNKGFTLVEVMAVIIILALLVTLGVNTYSSVYGEQQDRAYKTKVNTVIVAAEKWADEMNIGNGAVVSVQRLINDSFLQADSLDNDGNSVFDNPITKESLLCNLVSIQYVDGQYDIEFLEDQKNCEAEFSTEISDDIIVQKYILDNDNKLIGVSDPGNLWTKENVLLLVNYQFEEVESNEGDVSYQNSIEKISYVFGSNTVVKDNPRIYDGGITEFTDINSLLENYDNVYLVKGEDNKVIDTYVELFFNVKSNSKMLSLSNNTLVQIDRQAPSVLVDKSNLTEVSDVNKRIKITANDSNGSGINNVIVANNKSCDEGISMPGSDSVFEIDNGVYYACSVDKVGNINHEGVEFKVSGINKNSIDCDIVVDSGTLGDGSTEWYVSDVKIRLDTDFSRATKYGLSTKPSTDYNYVSNLTLTDNSPNDKGITYYGYVADNVGKIHVCQKNIKIDKSNPTISLSNATAPKGKGSTINPYSYLTINNENPSKTREKVCKVVDDDNFTCTLTKNNGKSVSASAKILHNYLATKNIRKYSCKIPLYGSWSCTWATTDKPDTSGLRYYACSCTADYSLSCTRYEGHEATDCRGNCGEKDSTCSETYYTCPNGGKLSGVWCVF